MGDKRVTQQGLTVVELDRRRRTCCSSAAPCPGPQGRHRGGAHRWLTRPILGGTKKRRRSTPTRSARRSTARSCTRSCAPSSPRAGRARTSTKTRGKVRGGGAKPWRQKGTGRARAGSIALADLDRRRHRLRPARPRHYTFKVNRKARRAALRSALSVHAERGSLAVLDAAGFDAPSTKQARRAARRAGRGGSVLVVLTDADEARGRQVVPQPRARRRAARPTTSASPTSSAPPRVRAQRGRARRADRPRRRARRAKEAAA